MGSQRPTRQASALLMVISMIVLMVTVATAFMSTMSRQRGTAVLLAARTRCEIGMEQAQARVIRQLLEERVDPTTTYSSKNSKWYISTLPINDVDGDVWTDDGIPLGTGYEDTENLINVGNGVDVADMMQRNSGDWRSEYYGFWVGSSSTPSRWNNLEFFDDFMQPIEILDTLTEAAKADLRRTARFVLRYTVKTMDCEAQLGANSNYPGAPIIYNPASPLEFNRYQSYLRHFGRSIKSMTATSNYETDARQYRSGDGDFCDTRDPYDFEELSVFPDGIQMKWSATASSHFGLENDLRLRRESAFRRESLAWVETSNNLDQKSPHLAGGNPLTTWYQIGRHNGGTGMNGAYYAPHFQFSPYAGSMLAEPLQTVNPDPCTVPWKVNLLTCAPQTVTAIYGGLSSHLKHGSGSYAVEPETVSSWWGKASYANADLFGPNYPEAFPLGYEDGKDIPLVGMISKATVPGYEYPNLDDSDPLKLATMFAGGVLTTGDNNIITPAQGGNYKYPATAFSYWQDLHYAWELARQRTLVAWNNKTNLSTNSSNAKEVEGYYYLMTNPDTSAKILTALGDSYIDKGETDPEMMINQVIMETCRILGEGYISPHSGATPAKSWNKYNNALPGLLAGGESFVGLNLKWNWRDYGMKRCKLSPQTNTRAMEFVLNDTLISLYGKANPHYKAGVDALENIAVDFNGDGTAESTLTGWLNPVTSKRTWSWWCNGLGPMGRPQNGDWMKESTWIRFQEDGTVQRKRGGQWVALGASERAEFLGVHAVFLNDTWGTAGTSPIRPFSHTGRLFIGKSSMFQSFIRTELYNIPKRMVMAASNRSFVYNIDPNKDGSYEDSHVASQQEFDMQTTDL